MTLIIKKPTGAQLRMRQVWQPMDPDAAAYITAVEAADGQALEDRVRVAIDNFVLGCKTDGTWSAIKASCILAGARTLNGALVPLVGTAPTQFGTAVGWNYNRKTGLQGNGTDNYLNSNRNNNADPQNSQHMAVYQTALNSGGSLGRLMSGRSQATPTGSSQITCAVTNNANELYSRFNGTTWSVSPRSSAPKFLGISRGSASEYSYRVGGTAAVRSDSSAAAASQNVLLYTDPRLTAEFYSNARIAFYSIGESLNLALFDARVTDLINAIGAAIT